MANLLHFALRGDTLTNVGICAQREGNALVIVLLQDVIWSYCGAEPFITTQDVRNIIPLRKDFEIDYDNIVF